MLWKINIIGNSDNIYFDFENKEIYFLNQIKFTFGFNILNPYSLYSEKYNKYNFLIIEILKLYVDYKRIEFENYIYNCIKNKNFYFCSFNSVEFTIEKSYLSLKDYEIVY